MKQVQVTLSYEELKYICRGLDRYWSEKDEALSRLEKIEGGKFKSDIYKNTAAIADAVDALYDKMEEFRLEARKDD